MDSNVEKTCFEMLQQRGFETQKKDGFIIGKKLSSDESIIVFYNEIGKLNVERVLEFLSQMKDYNIKHSIVIYKEAVTPVAKKVVEELQDIIFELFEEKTLRYNITQHRLVPKHTALTKVESSAFKKKYGLKIPVLLTTDPVSKFYFFQRGDIIKIERDNGFISYRIVK
jgi:DNA-directed RNA polymerase I, II, and III subunit RPABC1